jgi:tRNA nucleotidyltransferase (CCA-adding enzyme)
VIVLKEVILARKLVMPKASQEARLYKIKEKILKKTESIAKVFPEVTGVLIGGSFAKGTWLPEEADIDIFVKISPTVDDRRFEEIGLKIGRTVARGYPHGKKYAQHPYTEAAIDGVKINIVPCFDVKLGEWKSAADRSQYHVKFVQEKMDNRMKTEVRLLKRFMKVIDVYGAEIEREGFSGYCAEVLLYNHSSFENVIKYFASLKPISDERYLSITDPIDSHRDLAKAISRENVARLNIASRAFLKEPKIEFFKGIKRKVRRSLIKRLLIITFKHPKLSEDTLWGELKKSARHLVGYLGEHGFIISRSIAASDNESKSAIILLPENEKLSEIEDRIGPSIELAKEAEHFIQKNLDKAELIWAGEDSKLHILQRRRYDELKELLGELINGEIRKIGASSDIANSIINTGKVLRGGDSLKEARNERWLIKGIEEIVSDTIGTDKI